MDQAQFDQRLKKSPQTDWRPKCPSNIFSISNITYFNWGENEDLNSKDPNYYDNLSQLILQKRNITKTIDGW